MSAPPSPDPASLYILLGMTATTAIVDAVSLLALGHVFTANMTGNVVFLGFALAGVPGFSIPKLSMALMAFSLGAAAGGRLPTHMSSRPAPYWTSRAFCIDGLLLIGVALASLTLRIPGDENSIPLFGVIGLTALAMGTVLTLTITGLAADSILAGGTNPRWRRRVASALWMFSGAAVGSLTVKRSVVEALCVCGIASVACAFAVLGWFPHRRGCDSRSVPTGIRKLKDLDNPARS
jgi:uncharacterized membrane protein YoaK (UPF0700 family)